MFHRIVRALAANLFGQVATLFIQLVSVPLLIKQWGVVYYGEWLLLTSVPAYLSLSDGGVVSAMGNDLAISLAHGDEQIATKQLSSGLATVLGMSLLCGLGLMIVFLFTPYRQWLGIMNYTAYESQTTLIALCLYVFSSVQQELLSGVYRAEGQYDKGRIWITGARLFEFAVMIGIVYSHGKAPQVAVSYVVVRLLVLAGMWLDCWVRFKWVRQISLHVVDASTIRQFLTPSASFLVFAVANAIVLQGSVLLIGALLTPLHVVVYNTLRTISNAVRQLGGILNFSVWPEFTLALSQGRTQTAVVLHRLACQTTFWLTLAMIIGLEFMGGPLVRFWTKGAVQIEQPLFIMLLTSSLICALWNTSALTLISVNRHQPIAIAYLLMSVGALGLATILIPYWALSGLVSSFILADVVVLIVVIRFSLKLLERERLSGLIMGMLTDFTWLRQLGKLTQRNQALMEVDV